MTHSQTLPNGIGGHVGRIDEPANQNIAGGSKRRSTMPGVSDLGKLQEMIKSGAQSSETSAQTEMQNVPPSPISLEQAKQRIKNGWVIPYSIGKNEANSLPSTPAAPRGREPSYMEHTYATKAKVNQRLSPPVSQIRHPPNGPGFQGGDIDHPTRHGSPTRQNSLKRVPSKPKTRSGGVTPIREEMKDQDTIKEETPWRSITENFVQQNEQDRCGHLGESNKKLQQDLKIAQKANRGLKAECQTAKARLAEVREQTAKPNVTESEDFLNGLQRITKWQAETQQELGDVREELKSSEARTIQLKDELDVATKSIKVLHDIVEDAKNNNDELHNTNNRLNKELDEIKEQLTIANEYKSNIAEHTKNNKDKLHEELNKTKEQLTKANEYISSIPQHVESIDSKRDPSAYPIWESDAHAWHERYLSERAVHRALQSRFRAVQETAARAVEFEQAVKELRISLTSTQDELRDVIESNSRYKAALKSRQNEVEMCREREARLEDMVHKQKNEMLEYIRSYREKLEKDWSDDQYLHEYIHKLERARQEDNKEFDRTKRENAELKESIAHLKLVLTRSESYVENMQLAFLDEAPMPGPFWDAVDPAPSTNNTTNNDNDDDDAEHFLELTGPAFMEPRPRRNPTSHIPRCDLASSISSRNSQILSYAQQLARSREDAEKLERATERARRHRLEQSKLTYPPESRGWVTRRQKSSWERWDGQKWARDTAVNEDEDIQLAQGLFGKGVLDERAVKDKESKGMVAGTRLVKKAVLPIFGVRIEKRGSMGEGDDPVD